jgi:hypothetical protein
VAFHPFGLSYYNALVGGLPGAERLGLELTYWGDAVDGVLLDRLARAAPPDASAALAPTLYPGQGALTTTRAMIRVPRDPQGRGGRDRRRLARRVQADRLLAPGMAATSRARAPGRPPLPAGGLALRPSGSSQNSGLPLAGPRSIRIILSEQIET